MSHQYLNTSANVPAKTNLGRLATRARKTLRHLFLLVKSHAASDRICPKLKASCLIRQLLLQWPFLKKQTAKTKTAYECSIMCEFLGLFFLFRDRGCRISSSIALCGYLAVAQFFSGKLYSSKGTPMCPSITRWDLNQGKSTKSRSFLIIAVHGSRWSCLCVNRHKVQK